MAGAEKCGAPVEEGGGADKRGAVAVAALDVDVDVRFEEGLSAETLLESRYDVNGFSTVDVGEEDVDSARELVVTAVEPLS